MFISQGGGWVTNSAGKMTLQLCCYYDDPQDRALVTDQGWLGSDTLTPPVPTHGMSAHKRVKVNYGNSLCHSEPRVSISVKMSLVGERRRRQIITRLAFCGKLYELLTCQAARAVSTNSEKITRKLWAIALPCYKQSWTFPPWLRNVAQFRNYFTVSCHWIPELRNFGQVLKTMGHCLRSKALK